MIFRRIKAHIEKENWFAVFIDFLIVVTGVFIGIQVANWNAALSDKAIAQEYLERISIDFGEIGNRLVDNNIPDFDKSLDAIEMVDALIKSGKKPKGQADLDFRNALRRIHASSVPAWHSATYVEMQSAGDLKLLADKDLKIALTDYNQTTEIAHKGWNVLMGLTINITEKIDQFIEYEAVRDAPKGTASFVVSNYDFEKMLNNSYFKSDLSSLVRIQSNNLVLQKLQLEKAQAVLKILNQDTDK